MVQSRLNTLGLHPQAESVIFSNSYTGATGKQLSRNSASTLNNLVIIERLLDERKPSATLEIGMATGASTCVFGLFHASRNSRPGAHIALDPFQRSAWDSVGLQNVSQLGIESVVDVRFAFSCFELPKLVEEKQTFDLIYIDGSHLFEDVFVDVFYCMRLLSMTGVILFDDSQDPHVKKVLKWIKTSFKEHLQEIELTQYRSQTGMASIKSRLASAFGRTQASAFRKVGSGIRDWNTPFVPF